MPRLEPQLASHSVPLFPVYYSVNERVWSDPRPSTAVHSAQHTAYQLLIADFKWQCIRAFTVWHILLCWVWHGLCHTYPGIRQMYEKVDWVERKSASNVWSQCAIMNARAEQTLDVGNGGQYMTQSYYAVYLNALYIYMYGRRIIMQYFIHSVRLNRAFKPFRCQIQKIIAFLAHS